MKFISKNISQSNLPHLKELNYFATFNYAHTYSNTIIEIPAKMRKKKNFRSACPNKKAMMCLQNMQSMMQKQITNET